MAITVTPLADPAGGATSVYDSAAGATVRSPVTGTLEIVFVELDNTANSSTVYLKLWDDDASDVTLGTDAPELQIAVGANKKAQILFLGDRPLFSSAISYAVVTTPGTSGTTGPSNSVSLRMTVVNG